MFFRHIGFGIGHLKPMQYPQGTVESEQDDDPPLNDSDVEMDATPTSDLINLGCSDDENAASEDDDDGDGDDDDDDEVNDTDEDDNDDGNSDEDVGYAGL